MALELTTTGLTIQSLAEIKTELEDAFRASFGENTVVEADSVFGQIIGIMAEREALLQQLLLAVLSSFNPNNATGISLDALSALTATFRKSATNSKSASGLASGTPATVIVDGSQVRLIQTNDLWEVVDGPFVIGGGGTVAVTIQAVETGPKVFNTTPSTGWSIETPIVGWDTFETTADIDPEDTGRDIESDAELRERRKDELLIQGNDLTAIKAVVGALETVTAVKVFENTDCTMVVDGIDPGAFETVVDGGDDTEIAEAIFSRKPPGAEAFGSTTVSVADGEGGTIDIGFTRPTDIDIWVAITVDTTGAEGTFPTNGLQLIEDAFLAEANLRADIAADVVPKSYYGLIFEAVRDPDSGLDSITDVTVAMGLAPLPTLEDPIVIAIRERSDFDTARTTVAVI